jgi:hypothetical protein
LTLLLTPFRLITLLFQPLLLLLILRHCRHYFHWLHWYAITLAFIDID